MTKKYTIVVGDTDNIFHSTDIKECYKFMIDSQAEFIKNSTTSDREPLTYILWAITELQINHDDLAKPIKITDQGNHALDTISALRGATAYSTGKYKKLINEVVLERLYALPDVLSNRALNYILHKLDNAENPPIYYLFHERQI